MPVQLRTAVSESFEEDQFYFELSTVAEDHSEMPELLTSSGSDSDSEVFEQLLSDDFDQQDISYQRSRREQFAARWRGRQDAPDAQNGNLGTAFVDDVIHSHHRLEAEDECKSVMFESLDKATQTEEVILFFWRTRV